MSQRDLKSMNADSVLPYRLRRRRKREQVGASVPYSGSFSFGLGLAAAGDIAQTLEDVTGIPEDYTPRYSEQLHYVALEILWLSSVKYKEIVESCSSDNECLLKLVKCWIECCPDASWRWLIWKLEEHKFKKVANKIRHHAEPLTDTTLTYENVSMVLEEVDEEWIKRTLQIPCSKYKTKLILWWLSYSPFASWQDLASELFQDDWDFPAAYELAKGFFHHTPEYRLHFTPSPDPTLTASQLCAVFENEEDGWGQSEYHRFPASLNLPYIIAYPGWLNDYPYTFSRPDHIRDSNPSPSDYWKNVFELYLGNHPAPSWKFVARAAYMRNIDSATELILHKYIRGLSLQELCAVAISRFVRLEDIDELPLPKRIKLWWR